MLLSFVRGSASEPKGHALAYLRGAAAPHDVYATYLIVPPVAIDLAKYMPPMFASKISLADMQNLSAIPLPPMPEKVPGLEHLRHLAERRGDDMLDLGSIDVSDVAAVLAYVSEAAQEYLQAYTSYISSLPTPAPEPPPLSAAVEDVLYGLLTDRDRLGELAKLVGKLRYAVDGGDRVLVEETVAEMQALGKHLAEKYRFQQVVEAARLAGDRGRRLCELYVARCYKLCDEDYRAVEELDARIRELGPV